jgi:DNA invertase Pin-like site-specific DNA recombinase
MMRVAIYVRVSKSDGSQDEANQEPDCLQLCQARGWTDVYIHQERESGASKHRPNWEHLLALARQGAINAIVVWSLDRVGRSMWQTMTDVRELHRCGCQLVSVRDPWLDTGGPAAPLLLAIFAWVAEYERAHQIARTKAGIARAVAQGKRLGRPPKWIDPVKLRNLVGRGVTVSVIARRFQVSPRTIGNHLARARHAAKNGGVPAHRKVSPGRGVRRRG